MDKFVYVMYPILQTGLIVFDCKLSSMQANLSIFCLANVTGAIRLSALEWYHGASSSMDTSCPCLAICFENGRVQIMKHELDAGVRVCVCVRACVHLCLY